MKSSTVGSLSPEYVLLGLLTQGPAHGYELHQKLTVDLNQIWNLSQSQVYNILSRLEGKGFIRGRIQEQEKLPARRLLEITAAGQERFSKWMFAPSRLSVRAIRVELTTRLFFALDTEPGLADEIITRQIAEIEIGLERLNLTRASIPEDQMFNHLGLDLRIRQLGSILDWLDSCRAKISTNPSQERPV
jgi:DNA-binding PadR family transcriptional regulator